MRKNLLLRLVAIIMVVFVMGIPIALADQINLVHDKRGNLVTGDGFFREYNEFNQLVHIRNGSTISGMLLEDYTYHPTQERVLIKHVYNQTGGLKETVYYVSDEFVRVKNTSGTYDTVYVRVDGQLIAQKNPDGLKNFIHGDHLGSASVITDASGNPIENTSYSPFGEILSGGSKSRYSYTGQEFESVTGDFDYHARRYKAAWGQFVQPDTLLPNVYDPQQLNRYSYVKNNPYRYVDFSGHKGEEFLLALALVIDDLVETITRYVGIGLVAASEKNNQVEEQEYVDLYDAYKEQNPDLSDDPYIDVLMPGPHGETRRMLSRRINIDDLRDLNAESTQELIRNGPVLRSYEKAFRSEAPPYYDVISGSGESLYSTQRKLIGGLAKFHGVVNKIDKKYQSVTSNNKDFQEKLLAYLKEKEKALQESKNKNLEADK